MRIQLPGATEDGNPLAALLARIPWEIARPSTTGQTLAERNLLVRVVHDRQEPTTQTLSLQPDEPLRVLFVFAEARGARPLAARLERRALQALFAQKIYPKRRIVADFVMHGVTRERLRKQIEQNNGYHIVHWSGHGHLNLLELAGKDGQSDRISGEDLIGLFAEAGGFIPNLFFLSACHSGDLVRIHNWKEFTQLADPNPSVSKEATPTKELVLEDHNLATPAPHTPCCKAVWPPWLPCVTPSGMNTPEN